MSATGAGAEWRRGWRVVAASAVGVGTGAGLYQYLSSLFVEPLEATFGWDRGEIGSAAALGLLGALAAPLVGRIADGYGVRRVATLCILVVAAAHVALSMMTGPIWQFMAGIAVIGIAAPGCTGLVYSRAVNGWFDQGRGLALGVMSSGLSVATLLLSPLVAMVIADHGVRGGYLAMAAITALVGLPIVLLGVREPPPRLEPHPPLAAPADGLRAALRRPAFWLLAAIMFLVNAPAAGVLTQLVPLLTAKGLSVGAAAGHLALFAGAVLVGRIGIGWMFDRLSPKHVAAAVTLLGAGGCLLLLSPVPAAFAAAALLLVGLLQGAETDVLGYFVARLFGRTGYGAIYGALFTASLLGTAVGIVGFGGLFAATGGYDLALALAAAVLAVAAGLYLLAPRMVHR
jgi:predicted MFS family arabinose efflux permease